MVKVIPFEKFKNLRTSKNVFYIFYGLLQKTIKINVTDIFVNVKDLLLNVKGKKIQIQIPKIRR